MFMTGIDSGLGNLLINGLTKGEFVSLLYVSQKKEAKS